MFDDLDTYDCGRPDCVDCRIRRGERPMPSLMAEFEAVDAQIQRMAVAYKAGAQDRRVTIFVSEASLIALAFLDRLAQAQRHNGLLVIREPIDTSNPADFEGAIRHMAAMLVDRLGMEWAECRQGHHPLLFSPERRRNPDEPMF